MLPVADSIVLAGLVDATLLVVTAGVTTKRQVHRSLELLRQVDAPPTGLVLNSLGQEAGYGYPYGYSYGYAATSTAQAAASVGRAGDDDWRGRSLNPSGRAWTASRASDQDHLYGERDQNRDPAQQRGDDQPAG